MGQYQPYKCQPASATFRINGSLVSHEIHTRTNADSTCTKPCKQTITCNRAHDLVHHSPYRIASHRITSCPSDSCPHSAKPPSRQHPNSLKPTNANSQKRNHWTLSNSFFSLFPFIYLIQSIFNISCHRSMSAPAIYTRTPSARRLPHSSPFRGAT